MKQTAVEWLEEQIICQQNIYIDLGKKNKTLKKQVDAILTATTLLKMKCEQAKEMEKENVKNGYGDGIETIRKSFSVSSHIPKGAEEYYNETFNK